MTFVNRQFVVIFMYKCYWSTRNVTGFKQSGTFRPETDEEGL